MAALVSRLEKNFPAEATPDDVSTSMNGLKIDQAPEPLREVLAAKTAAGQDNGGAVPDEQKTLNKNPSMHLGGYVFKGGEQGGAPSPPPTLGTVPSFSVGSPSRDGGDYDASASSPPGAEERKRAEDVLVDKSEEIFGKAFRGGPKAAAGLMARLQREVSLRIVS